jgi:multiple sugar transport system permease protein
MYDIPFNLNQYPSLVAFNGTYIKCTQTVLMYVNQLAFGKSSIKQVGIASAVSVILFIVTTILSILIFFLMRDKDAAAAAKAKKLARKAGR